MDYNEIIKNYGYIAVFAGSFVDHFGLPAYAMAGAALSAFPEFQLSPQKIFLYSFCGGLASDTVYYLAGRKIPELYFTNLVNSFKAGIIIKPLHYWIIEKSFLTIALGRFVAIAGRFISPLAGIYKISYKQFFTASILGNILYFSIFIPISFYTGKSIINKMQAARFLQFFIGIIILTLLYKAARRGGQFFRKKND